MDEVAKLVRQARCKGYSEGYWAGRRYNEKAARQAPPAPPVRPTHRWSDDVPPGPYADMERSLRSMDLFFQGLLADYPNSVGMGRMDKWAAAATAFIDLMASVDKPAKRANLRIVGDPDDRR